MWRFTAADERRYDCLLGLRSSAAEPRTIPVAARRRGYLLSVAARLCKWRDGRDPRRGPLSQHEAKRIEGAMLRDLAETIVHAEVRVHQPSPRASRPRAFP